MSRSMSCPDDTELVAFAQGLVDDKRREAVLSHIETCPECAGLAAEAARDARDAVETFAEEVVPVEEPPKLTRGASVGRYLLLDLIGSGALGQVFTAYDPELDRKVAIKVLLPSVLRHRGGEEFRTRMVREAQALARVKHPNVVAVHDVGYAQGQMFIAMELVEGQTLGDWLSETRSWEAVRDVFLAAGEGLRAAHDAGLVHRDFKPSNVLIDASGRVQVADFGLARAIDSAVVLEASPSVSSSGRALEASMTASGAVIGTPAYMPPEQHRGANVDARSDQFSFCVALYEGLYGKRPFQGGSMDALREAAESGKFETSDRAVPSWLRRAVMRGLRADPAERYPSMDALLEALQQDRTSRKRWIVAAALAIVGIGGAVWTVGASGDALDTTQVDALAIEARAAAAKFYWVYPPRLHPDEPTAYVKVLELEGLEGPVEDQADARGAELRDEFAGTLVRLGDEYWERPGGAMFANDYYAAALVFDPDHPRALERAQLTPAGLDLMRQKAAGLSFSDGELAAAEPLLALALPDDAARKNAVAKLYVGPPKPPATTTAALTEMLGPVGPKAAPTYDVETEPEVEPSVVAELTPDRRGRKRTSRPRADPQPETPPPEVQPASVAKPETADPEASMAEAKLGLTALQQGRLAEAERHFHAAVALHRRNPVALAGLGEVFFQREAFERSAKFFERAIAVKPNKARYRIDLGDVYLRVLRYDDARAQYRKAQQLGHKGAGKRLAKLDAKTGAQ